MSKIGGAAVGAVVPGSTGPVPRPAKSVWIVVYDCLPENDGYDIDSAWTNKEAAMRRADMIPGPRSWTSIYQVSLDCRPSAGAV